MWLGQGMENPRSEAYLYAALAVVVLAVGLVLLDRGGYTLGVTAVLVALASGGYAVSRGRTGAGNAAPPR